MKPYSPLSVFVLLAAMALLGPSTAEAQYSNCMSCQGNSCQPNSNGSGNECVSALFCNVDGCQFRCDIFGDCLTQGGGCRPRGCQQGRIVPNGRENERWPWLTPQNGAPLNATFSQCS